MNMNNAPIGIFDSGLGGLSVLKECLKYLPKEQFIYYGDTKHAPYGTKKRDSVIERCIFICDFLIQKNVKAIVVACNTATSVAIETLRERYDIPIIGVEPALKLATSYKQNQNIVVMATPLTLKEKKFSDLIQKYGKDNHIIKMPCPEFVSIVEKNPENKQELVDHQINEYKDLLTNIKIDCVVLGCTHFVFLKDYIENYFNHNVILVDGNIGTARNLKNILASQNILGNTHSKLEIYNSSNDPKIIELSKKLIDQEN